MNHSKQKALSRLQWVAVLLAALLIISCVVLAARYFYKQGQDEQTMVTVPDNLIAENEEPDQGPAPSDADTETEGQDPQSSATQTNQGSNGYSPARSAAAGGNTSAANTTAAASDSQPKQAMMLELYQGRADANKQFKFDNIFPGDHMVQYFCIRIHHNQPVEVLFQTKVTQQTKNLDQGLRISVTRLGNRNPLCDDTFWQVNGRSYSEEFQPPESGITDVYYRVDVYADTSMGNEYQQASLTADLNWYARDVGTTSPEAGGTVNALTSPQTGDTTHLLFWAALAILALLLTVLLWVSHRKEAEKDGRR